MTETGAMPEVSKDSQGGIQKLTNKASSPEQADSDPEMRRYKVGDPVGWERCDPQDDEEGKDSIPSDLFTFGRIAHNFHTPCFHSGAVEGKSEQGWSEQRRQSVAQYRANGFALLVSVDLSKPYQAGKDETLEDAIGGAKQNRNVHGAR